MLSSDPLIMWCQQISRNWNVTCFESWLGRFIFNNLSEEWHFDRYHEQNFRRRRGANLRKLEQTALRTTAESSIPKKGSVFFLVFAISRFFRMYADPSKVSPVAYKNLREHAGANTNHREIKFTRLAQISKAHCREQSHPRGAQAQLTSARATIPFWYLFGCRSNWAENILGVLTLVEL